MLSRKATKRLFAAVVTLGTITCVLLTIRTKRSHKIRNIDGHRDRWLPMFRAKPVVFPTIKEYHARVEAICRQEWNARLNGTRNLCECISNQTRSADHRLDVNYLLSLTWTQVEESLLDSSSGYTQQETGTWRPTTCHPRRRISVIIPFRDRGRHLSAFLAHSIPIWMEQQVEFRIFVVEQNRPYIFNKAAMMNVGFLESVRAYPADCVLFHDVDLLVESSGNILVCDPNPTHMAQLVDSFNYSLPYGNILGGAVLISPSTFREINGFSNTYFGWGGEDDDFNNRVVHSFYKVYRPPPSISRYTAIPHDRDHANPHVKSNIRGFIFREKAAYARDGLNSRDFKYDVVEKQEFPLFTHILVDLLRPEIVPTRLGKAHASLGRTSTGYDVMKGTCQDDPSFWQTVVERQQDSEETSKSSVNGTVLPYSTSTCQYICDTKPECTGIEVLRMQYLETYCVLLMQKCLKKTIKKSDQALTVYNKL